LRNIFFQRFSTDKKISGLYIRLRSRSNHLGRYIFDSGHCSEVRCIEQTYLLTACTDPHFTHRTRPSLHRYRYMVQTINSTCPLPQRIHRIEFVAMGQPDDCSKLEDGVSSSASSSVTTHDLHDLRRVGDTVPWRLWVVALIGFWERAAFWGLLAPWRKLSPSHFI
jgi:hypothetical protein